MALRYPPTIGKSAASEDRQAQFRDARGLCTPTKHTRAGENRKNQYGMDGVNQAPGNIPS